MQLVQVQVQVEYDLKAQALKYPFGKTIFLNGRGCSLTESFLIACISLVNEPDKYARAHEFPQVCKYTCIIMKKAL